MNSCNFVGRLSKDPNLTFTSTGKAVCNFTIAINKNYTNADGSRDADFLNCVIWGKRAEALANYNRKGSRVGVNARAQSRFYEAEGGKKVYVTEFYCDEVEFLENKENNQTAQ
ncbi:single-stranded DNA-binding protein [Listeria booriae]|uniref:single-stranded DNA-binding protein n=1 Tax=Listeria booriae TaxID=1552123 RepID=UPI001625FDBB|nr:single-stranded DNA-binding protein [Listeria booriae]MBC1920459.1 single-stranded DNA-binding protein [Listeria booriae]